MSFSSNEITDLVVVGRDDVSNFNEENILPQPPEVLAEIRAWLRPTAYDEEGREYRKHLSSRVEGTGGWLFSTNAYREWHSSPGEGLLWIRGIPGSGKSVFAASFVDRLQREEGCPVLFFFFRQIIDANHTPVAALHDWLAQVLNFSPPLQAILKGYLDAKRDLDSLSIADLWRHIRQATIYIPRAYVIVDALDEMDQTKDLEPFLHALAELSVWRPAQVKVAITSRYVPYIERPLRAAKALHIRLEERQVDVDIATYVQHRLALSAMPMDLHVRIKETVPKRANGLFVYAKLAMDALLRPGTDVDKALQQFPPDLNVMYTDLLRGHSVRSGVPADTQFLILQAATHATRPLRLLEMAELINVTQYPPEMRNRKAAKDLVRSACGPLLEILPDETVSVVHHSLTEFLTGASRHPESANPYPILEPGPTHNRLALVCLSYLLSGSLDHGQIRDQESITLYPRFDNHTRHLPPFTQYAVVNWAIHAQKAGFSGHDQTEINGLLDELLTGSTLQRWIAVWNVATQQYLDQASTPLMVAVKLGLSAYVKVLLSRPDTDVNTGDEKTGSPLYYAVRGGHEDVVRLLLAAGADMNKSSRYGETPVIYAATHNRPNIIKIFADAGAHLFARVRLNNGCDEALPSANYTTPMGSAIQHGHLDVVKVLLPYIETAEQAHNGLQAAVDGKRSSIVEVLLQHPQVNIKDGNTGSTLLFTACSQKDAKTIHLLLQAGVSPNEGLGRPSWRGRNDKNTPLHALANRDPYGYCPDKAQDTPENTIECFEMLLAAGVNVNGVDDEGASVLHDVKDAVLARLLVDAGADPNTTNRRGETLLHTCQNADILQILLSDSKIDMEQRQTRDEATPLLCALKGGRTDLAIRLLEAGANAFAVDHKGNGILHLAVGVSDNGSSSITADSPCVIQRLRECGGDPNLRNYNGDRPLHVLMHNVGHYRNAFNESVLAAIVAAGANLEGKDREGRTPLFRLMSSNRSRLDAVTNGLQALIHAGARADTLDLKGRTLFHVAAADPASLFSFCVSQGLDPKRTDHSGNTLWHECARVLAQTSIQHTQWERKPEEEHPPFVLPLLNLGVDPVQPNHLGQTPLHRLCMFRHNGVYDESTWRNLKTRRDNTLRELVLDYMIRQYAHCGVDQTDRDGVTALHIASTHCAHITQRLLRAGADPLKSTHEGLTALHLAARSRMPNIVGILLAAVKSATATAAFLKAVNAKDRSYTKNTPLNFACTSGQSESVRLLMEAGATVNSESLWASCVGFENETRNWPKPGQYEDFKDRHAPDAAGVLLEDTHRRKPPNGGTGTDPYPAFPVERLDDIVDLIGSYGLTAGSLDKPVLSAAAGNLDYTVDCLSRKRNALPQSEAPSKRPLENVRIDMCLGRREANREAIRRAVPQGRWKREETKLSHFMALRDYDLAAEELLKGGGLEANHFGFTTLHDLVSGGFASIMRKVLTRELLAKLDEWEVRRTFQGNSRRRYNLSLPLLAVACQTVTPNMEVIRVLVEVVGANVNAPSWKPGYSQIGSQDDVKDETPLHILATGAHWWQVAEAIPYLASHGADLEARNAGGLTPLLAALQRIEHPLFDPRVIEVLVALGANVDAADPKGVSCLGLALGDLTIVKLLLKHTTDITVHSAMAAAIREQRHQALEALLAHGANPNVRQTPKQRDQAKEVTADAPPDPNPKSQKKTIQLLLDHGANPNAGYENTTVLHRVVEHSRFARDLLCFPSINIEARNSHGHTLLHAACRAHAKDENGDQISSGESCSPAYMLLDRGADVRAVSNNGRTALHHHISPGPGVNTTRFGNRLDTNLLRRLALAAPDIVDLYDHDGHTALHLALLQGNTEAAAVLLDIGAGPKKVVAGGTIDTSLHLLLAKTRFRISADNVVRGPARDVFDALIAGGANPNARNAAGETPLFAFFGHKWPGGVDWDAGHSLPLVGRSAQRLVDETAEIRKKVTEEALWAAFEEANMDWTARNGKGEGLLHIVAGNTNTDRAVERFKVLVAKGLDPMAEDDEQRTALDVAASVGCEGILTLFKRNAV
ncbi:ankyrin repeat-containing domain protein [Chaetomidium leptoderma]|uniref:Ankyrin repeat-containing domain protein n=1 Tax=Chaetomidium leptoderma TaxID=669021 RepID=A0AAN6VDA5_9PEZI|nr:ankyrin repeat-containing domain protein [Chaetomidium leptoderma]